MWQILHQKVGNIVCLSHKVWYLKPSLSWSLETSAENNGVKWVGFSITEQHLVTTYALYFCWQHLHIYTQNNIMPLIILSLYHKQLTCQVYIYALPQLIYVYCHITQPLFTLLIRQILWYTQYIWV